MSDQLVDAASNDRIILHNSMLSTYTDCEQKFEYAYRRGWRPPTPRAMERGTWFHALAAVHHVRKGIEQGTLLRIPETLDLAGTEVKVTDDLTVQSALDVMADEHYSSLPREVKETLDGDDKVYGEEYLNLSFPGQVWDLFQRWLWHEEHHYEPSAVLLVEEQWTNEYEGLTFGGRLDLMKQRQSGPVVLTDIKTTTSLPSMTYRLTTMQTLLYAWGILPLLEEVGADESPAYVEYDYIVTSPPSMLRLKKNLTKAEKEAGWDYAPYANVGSMDEFAFLAQCEVLDVDPMHDAFESIREAIDGYDNDTHPYFRRWEKTINPKSVKRMLDEHVGSWQNAKEILTGERIPSRNLHPVLCGMCDHADECAIELNGGSPDAPSTDRRTLPLVGGGEVAL